MKTTRIKNLKQTRSSYSVKAKKGQYKVKCPRCEKIWFDDFVYPPKIMNRIYCAECRVIMAAEEASERRQYNEDEGGFDESINERDFEGGF